MSDKYTIEHGVPIPPFNRGRKWAELAERMKAGDSVILRNKLEVMKLRSAILRRGFDCIARDVDSDHPRVWKIEKKTI